MTVEELKIEALSAELAKKEEEVAEAKKNTSDSLVFKIAESEYEIVVSAFVLHGKHYISKNILGNQKLLQELVDGDYGVIKKL